jgi:LAS superfamily LD-carboxypeptidase LdcB
VTYRQPARRNYRGGRIRRRRVVALLVVIVAIAAALRDQSPATSVLPVPSISAVPSSSTAAPPIPQRELPGTDNLDGDLLEALEQAAAAAADDGIALVVDSGWRSPEHQEQLLREAIVKYGSEAEAARWVATPKTSAHVSGDAVDIGPTAAAAWLSEHGADYGLCQIYGNEPWHYELRPDAVDFGCPAMYADPTHDPRMQR